VAALMDDLVVEVLERLRVLHLEPDDTLVIMAPTPLSVAAVEYMQDQLLARFPGRRFMVLDSGTQVGILRQGALDSDGSSDAS
jgi:hypothetical protein